MSEYTPWLKTRTFSLEEEPILGDYFSDYMNREDVLRDFNIPSEVQADPNAPTLLTTTN